MLLPSRLPHPFPPSDYFALPPKARAGLCATLRGQPNLCAPEQNNRNSSPNPTEGSAAAPHSNTLHIPREPRATPLVFIASSNTPDYTSLLRRVTLCRALEHRVEFALPQNPDAHGAARVQIRGDGEKRMARRLVGLQFGPRFHALCRSSGQGARTRSFLQLLLPSLAQLARAMESNFTASGRRLGKTLGSYCPCPSAKTLQTSPCRAPGSTPLAPIFSAPDRLQSRRQGKVNRSKP
jgi:hypothetical protein